MDHLSTLNPAQKEAVLHTTGPLIIVAGAGTGKTKVLTHRMLNLINEGVHPESILAITFTNKAAGEMKERLIRLLKDGIVSGKPIERMPYVGTFHSFGVSVLKAHAHRVGMPRHFSIFDRDDSLSLIKKIQKDLGIDPKRFAPGALLSLISRSKGEAVGLDEYKQQSANDFKERIVASVWERYQNELAKEKAFDFDDLLFQTLHIFKNNPDILKQYRDQYSHIHIDEYQDTNIVQYELARLLAQPKNNICVVGDHDQCIYTWRSADLRNLARFEKEFSDTKVIVLEENYRSTKTILAAANDAIRLNEHRKEKNLFTKNRDGELIEVKAAVNETDEARWIVERIKEIVATGVLRSDIAVLFRAHFQSRALEEAFLSGGVPYQMLGTRFFERKEVKDVMSYLHAARNPESATHVTRAISTPARGIGKVSLLRVLSGREHELSATLAKKVSDFRALLQKINGASETLPPSKLVELIVKSSGIEDELAAGGDDDQERLLNIKELAALASRYDFLPPRESVEAFIEAVSLASDQDSLSRESDSVKLMTIHAAKGLEFSHVFITGLEEGLFPNERSDMRETPEEREEERRLFYVALTRARHQAHLSYASVRTLFGSTTVNIPSRFLTDIDESLVSVSGYGAPGHRELLTIDLDDL